MLNLARSASDAKTRLAAPPTAAPAATIAAEVALALNALRRAVAAGKTVYDNTSLEILLDDLAVITGDLRLVARDLRDMGP